MKMLEAMLQFLYTNFIKPQILSVHSDEEKEVKLVVHNGGKSEVMEFPKQERPRNHLFDTIDDFIQFLKTSITPGVIFINNDKITANLAYQVLTNKQYAIATMMYSEEFKALMSLKSGVSQKLLWRLLSTVLNESIDPQLAMLVSSLNIKSLANSETKINIFGMDKVDASYEIVLELGVEKVKFPVDWEWTGRIWQCFPNVIEIPLRMEITAEESENSRFASAKFLFHPVRLETILTEQRTEIAKHLRAALPEWGVYLGTE